MKIRPSQLTGKEIIRDLHDLINKYNALSSQENKIILKPDFFASKLSLYLGLIATCLFISELIFTIIYKGALTNLLIIAGLTLNFWIQRISAIASYKKFKS